MKTLRSRVLGAAGPAGPRESSPARSGAELDEPGL